jgi:hypothetical protein
MGRDQSHESLATEPKRAGKTERLRQRRLSLSSVLATQKRTLHTSILAAARFWGIWQRCKNRAEEERPPRLIAEAAERISYFQLYFAIV